MAKIAFLLDIEEGHFFPSFKLAKDLTVQGHEVCYLGLASAEPMVRRAGFELVPIFERLMPGVQRAADAGAFADWFGALASGEALDAVIYRLKPDAIVILSLYYPEALVLHFRYRLPILLLTPFCRPSDTTRAQMIEGLIAKRLMGLKSATMETMLQIMAAAGFQFRAFKELADVVEQMPELILLPKAIELPGLADEPHVFYLGSGVDLTRGEEPFSWHEIDPDRYLIYCSLGSQSELVAATARRFFHSVLGAAESHPEWQLILAVGKRFDLAELASVPANVKLNPWVPQLEVLRRADLMVTHGGPGTVKECIMMGVPMVVMPLMRDQFEMARRIVHHRLGVEGNLAEVTPEIISSLISQVAADGAVRERVAAMRERFLEEDEVGLGVQVVEAAIAKPLLS